MRKRRKKRERVGKMDFSYFFWNSRQFLKLEEQGTKLGFTLYCRGHLIWLLVIALATALISSWYIRLGGERRVGRFSRRSNAVYPPTSLQETERKRKRVRHFFAIAIVGSEIVRDLIIALTGNFRLEYLPFHLCGFAIFAMLADAYAENQKMTGQFMAYAFMPGATAALLFCNWTEYPFLTFMCIYSFVFHAWIVFYTIMRFRAGEIRPDYKGLWQTVCMILLLAGPLFLFNQRFGTNFLFINEASAGSPLVPIWNVLGTRFGYPGYLAGCILLVIVVFHVLWLVYFLLQKGMDKREKGGLK